MFAPVPPIDQIARVLISHGAREHGMALLSIHAARKGPDSARCHALLSALQARPTDRPSAPHLSIDQGMVRGLASAGLLPEARAVARGLDLSSHGGGELAAALEQVLEDVPVWVPNAQRRIWLEITQGSASALDALEAEPAIDPWIRHRAMLASWLLRGTPASMSGAASAPPAEVPAPSVPESLRGAVAAKVNARDLPGALELARQHASPDPGVAIVVAILARLVRAIEQAGEEQESAGRDGSTTAMSGHHMGLFQLRLGNLAEAERTFRAIVLDAPGDAVASERLQDVAVLRRVLEEGSATPPAGLIASGLVPEAVAPSAVLDKRNKKASNSGWAAGGWARTGEREAIENVDTNEMSLEEEAELLVRSGRYAKALEILRRMSERAPNKPGLANRIAEVEAMLAGGAAAEPTKQVDIFAKVHPKIDPSGITDEEPTLIGRRPGKAPDPLAQTLNARAAAGSDDTLRPPALKSAAPLPVIVGSVPAAPVHAPAAPAPRSAQEAQAVAVHRIVLVK